MHGQADDDGFLPLPLDHLGGLDAVHLGHGNVHDDEIRFQEQNLSEEDSFLLSAGECAKRFIDVGNAEFFNDFVYFRIVIPGVEFFHFLKHSLHAFGRCVRMMDAILVFLDHAGYLVGVTKEQILHRSVVTDGGRLCQIS